MKKSTLFLIVLVAIFFTSTLYLLYLNYLKPQSISAPNTGIIPTETFDPTENWETYNSSDFSFSINYPQDLLIQDYINDQYNRTVSFKGSDIYFSITLRKVEPNFNLDKYYFMDSPIARTTTLFGQKANVYEMPRGYCDGPGCGQPYISIVTEHNNDVYSLSFFGDSELSLVESQILSTFKFISSTTPTKSTTTSAINNDQKAYSSSLYGISFQYPSQAKIIGDINSHIFSLNIDSKIVSVIISSNPEKLIASEFFLNQISSENPDSIKDYVKFSSAKYNGNTFTKVAQDSTYFKQQSGPLNHYLISSKNYIVEFSYSEAGEITQQILSTFKLL